MNYDRRQRAQETGRTNHKAKIPPEPGPDQIWMAQRVPEMRHHEFSERKVPDTLRMRRNP